MDVTIDVPIGTYTYALHQYTCIYYYEYKKSIIYVSFKYRNMIKNHTDYILRLLRTIMPYVS